MSDTKEITHEIELSDLTEDAVRRLLMESWRQQAINSMPQAKRKKAKMEMEEEGEGDDEGYCKACKENDAKVAMNRGDTKPSLPSVTTDDLPKGIKVAKAKKEKKNNG